MKISVIIPVYNVELYLRRCLDSIINQTFKDLEIIIINDCSNDNSNEIINEYAAKDTRIVLIANEKNIGQGLSRQKGIDYAHGKYVTFVDSDDYIESEMYEELYKKAEESDYDVVGCDFTYVFNNGRKVLNSIPENKLNGLSYKFILDSLISSEQNKFIPNSLCNKIYKFSFIKENQIEILSERSCFLEDLLFNITFFSCKPTVSWIHRSYYNYMIRTGSTMYSYQQNFVNRYKAMHLMILQALQKQGLSTDEYIENLNNNLFAYTFTFLGNAFKNPDFKLKFIEFYKTINSPFLKNNIKKFPPGIIFNSSDRLMKKWIKYILLLLMRVV